MVYKWKKELPINQNYYKFLNLLRLAILVMNGGVWYRGEIVLCTKYLFKEEV
jgi:hypothetical protein